MTYWEEMKYSLIDCPKEWYDDIMQQIVSLERWQEVEIAFGSHRVGKRLGTDGMIYKTNRVWHIVAKNPDGLFIRVYRTSDDGLGEMASASDYSPPLTLEMLANWLCIGNTRYQQARNRYFEDRMKKSHPLHQWSNGLKVISRSE